MATEAEINAVDKQLVAYLRDDLSPMTRPFILDEWNRRVLPELRERALKANWTVEQYRQHCNRGLDVRGDYSTLYT
jgi:hypothetical protein